MTQKLDEETAREYSDGLFMPFSMQAGISVPSTGSLTLKFQTGMLEWSVFATTWKVNNKDDLKNYKGDRDNHRHLTKLGSPAESIYRILLTSASLTWNAWCVLLKHEWLDVQADN